MDDTERIFEFSRTWLQDPTHAAWIERLEAIERGLPRTTCEHRGACCDSTLWSATEYHRAMADLARALDADDRRRLVQHLLDYEPRRRARDDGRIAFRCAFRDGVEQRCGIYPVRALACRAYGLLPGTCDRVEVTAGEPLTPERFAALVGEVERMTEVIPADPPIPLLLPVEIWVRAARDGLREAMRHYFESPFYAQVRQVAASARRSAE